MSCRQLKISLNPAPTFMTVNDLLEAKGYEMAEIDSLGRNWQVDYKRIDYGSQASV